jgi:hypothetical protein
LELTILQVLNVADGISITLIQVLQLVPEKYQRHIQIPDDIIRSPPYSWLDENVMNAVVCLGIELKYSKEASDEEKEAHEEDGDMEGASYEGGVGEGDGDEQMKDTKENDSLENADQEQDSQTTGDEASDKNEPTIYFARDLASGICRSLDGLYEEEYKTVKSYLDYLLAARKNGEGSSAWNPDQRFTIPANTQTLVFFWNYSYSHWILVRVCISAEQWEYYIHDSLEADATVSPENDTTLAPLLWCLTKLQRLICAASGIATPTQPSYMSNSLSIQQKNYYDCGVIAAWNALATIHEISLEHLKDANIIRYECLKMIVDWLREKNPT